MQSKINIQKSFGSKPTSIKSQTVYFCLHSDLKRFGFFFHQKLQNISSLKGISQLIFYFKFEIYKILGLLKCRNSYVDFLDYSFITVALN